MAEAVRLMAERRIGALVVSADGRAIDGILGERDVVSAVAAGRMNMEGLTVEPLMTAEVFTCSPEDSTDDLIELMDRHYIRHLPVVENGALAGLVSVRDVVSSRMREIESERAQLRRYISGGLSQTS